MENLTTITNKTARMVELIGFEVKDRFGRELGTKIMTWEATFENQPADARSGYSVPAGRYFMFEVHATRNDEDYGASQGWQRFNTVEEREAAINKYLAGAKARAIKNQGK